ncbi:MAG: ATP-binding protein [Leptospiraceae bacterium]|nr:ATP-binding protein [Leptospiraceae bacterium]
MLEKIKELLKNPFSSSLKNTLLIPFLFILFLLITLFSLLYFKYYKDSLRKVAFELISQTSYRVSQHLTEYMQKPVLFSQEFEFHFQEGKIDPSDLNYIKKYFFSNYDKFNLSYLGLVTNNNEFIGAGEWYKQGSRIIGTEEKSKRTGRRLLAEYANERKEITATEFESFDPTDLEFYEKGLGRKKPYWSETFTWPDIPDSLAISWVHPLYKKDTYYGLLNSEIIISVLRDYLISLEMNYGTIYIVDYDGKIIVSSSKFKDLIQVNGKFQKQIAQESEDELIRKSAEIIFSQPKINLGNSFEKRFDSSGGDALVYVKPWSDFHGLKWIVVISVYESLLMKEFQKVANLAGIFSLFLFIGIFFIGLFAINKFVNPIKDLNEAARKISNGQFSEKVKVPEKTELRELAISFNIMADSLFISFEEMEEMIRERTYELEKANHTKDIFLANMSHEMRTPLNGILGVIQLLNHKKRSPEEEEYFRVISLSGETLLSIINDILDYTKIDSGKLELDNNNFEVKTTIDDTVKMFYPIALKKEIELEHEYDDSIPKFLNGDPTRLRQILFNLIGNAIKFTERGKVKVITKLLSIDENKIRLRITIEDTGIGIEETNITKLFQSFTQADSSVSRKYGGTGLGLVISKKLCELMNGHIEVESEYGKGSSFTFEVELILPDDSTPLEKKEIIQSKPIDYNEWNFLVAEDNEINKMVAKELLAKIGIKPDFVNNGRAAVEAVQKKDYDLIFMDIQMPEMDGEKATIVIREEMGKKQRPYIIAMTANAMKGDKEKYISIGMNDYISKPFKLEELQEKIETIWKNAHL